MGMLRAKTNISGTKINGILLGDPAIVTTDGLSMLGATSVDDLWFAWDDDALPTADLVPQDPIDGIITTLLEG